jgi:predicted amidophosphoribosyltransferase
MNTSSSSNDPRNSSGFISKKCPECMEYMPLNVEVCPSCKLPVGKINRHGMATRKTDWKGYVVALVAWIVFFFYVWWAFIREP